MIIAIWGVTFMYLKTAKNVDMPNKYITEHEYHERLYKIKKKTARLNFLVVLALVLLDFSTVVCY